MSSCLGLAERPQAILRAICWCVALALVSSAIVASHADAFVTTKSRGLGLGLSICHSIVEAHDGRLWAFNNPERGSTFCVSLPLDMGAGP